MCFFSFLVTEIQSELWWELNWNLLLRTRHQFQHELEKKSAKFVLTRSQAACNLSKAYWSSEISFRNLCLNSWKKMFHHLLRTPSSKKRFLLQQRNIKGSTSQIKDQDSLFFSILVQIIISNRSCSWFIDNANRIQSWNHFCIILSAWNLLLLHSTETISLDSTETI